MLGAAPELGRHTLVDAEIGRQAQDIIGRLQAYRDAGELPERVVVQIGENGPVTGGELAELRRVLKGVARVVIVNVRVPRSWGDSVNALAGEVRRPLAARRGSPTGTTRAPKQGLLYDDATHPAPRRPEDLHADRAPSAAREMTAVAPTGFDARQ